MNNKGFTLVELIAVIAILSILVLIASISITKLLSDAKIDLSDTQIALIKTAAETWGADNIMDLPDVGKCSYITLGDLKEYGLLDSNVIDAKNGNNISNELQIKITTTANESGNPVTTYEVNPDSTNGCSKAITICELVSGTSKTYGAKYNCTVKPGATYKFYVLGENDDNTINLIMSANITSDGVPITDLSLVTVNSTVAWNSSGVISDGPVSAMNYLYEATKDWTKIPNIELNYMDEGGFSNWSYSPSYAGISTKENITLIIPKSVSESTPPDLNDNASATYTDLKARLPKSSELSNLQFGSGNEFLYDNLRWQDGSSFCPVGPESSSELFGDSYNCINSDYLDDYWSLSSYATAHAVYLRTYGEISEMTPGGMIGANRIIYKLGIRPVITLPSSELE